MNENYVCEREKTLRELIRDLARPEIKHDLKAEAEAMERLYDAEVHEIHENYRKGILPLEKRVREMEAIISCMAEGVMRMRGQNGQ